MVIHLQKNIDKIKNPVRPKTKIGLRSLLGLANYFKELIPKYAKILKIKFYLNSMRIQKRLLRKYRNK